MSQDSDWSFDNENWKELNLDVLLDIQRRAELSLESSVEKSEKINQRAFILIGILIPIIGYLINEIPSGKSGILVYILIIAGMILIGGATYILFPKLLYAKGGDPKIWAIDDFLIPDKYNKLEQLKAYHLSVVEDLQKAIQHNDKENEKRLKLLQRLIVLILAILLVSFLVVLFFPVSFPSS